ncbi:MAG: hypothetical protein AB7R67_21745 [Vicinamibacterales bacterium]
MTFAARLRVALARLGLQGRWMVVETAEGVVSCVAPAPPCSDEECARALSAWCATCTRVR